MITQTQVSGGHINSFLSSCNAVCGWAGYRLPCSLSFLGSEHVSNWPHERHILPFHAGNQTFWASLCSVRADDPHLSTSPLCCFR